MGRDHRAGGPPKAKTLNRIAVEGSYIRCLAMTYFHMANATLSSARSGFTSEFEKGSGGSHSLWSPGNSGGPDVVVATSSKFVIRVFFYIRDLRQALCHLTCHHRVCLADRLGVIWSSLT